MPPCMTDVAGALCGMYEQVDSAAVDLMLNWGPIIYCLVVIPVMIYSKKPGSGRVLLIVGGTLCAVGATARLIPVWIDGLPHTLTMCLVHFGQILNAAVGPIVMSLPPKVTRGASVWWQVDETLTLVCACAGALDIFHMVCGQRARHRDRHWCVGEQRGRRRRLFRAVPGDAAR